MRARGVLVVALAAALAATLATSLARAADEEVAREPLALQLSGGLVLAAGSEAGASRLWAFRPEALGPADGHARALDLSAALWEAGRSVDAARPYGELPPGAPLRDARLEPRERSSVKFWPGRRAFVGRPGRGLAVVPSLPLSPAQAAASTGAASLRGGFGPPVLVGAPNDLLALRSELPGYDAFLEAARLRRRVVYASTPNGALHAFDAGSARGDGGSGAEIFGFRVEGETGAAGPRGLSFGDAFVETPWAMGGRPCPAETGLAGRRCQWRTLLAGLSSARALYVLDVTQPDASSPGTTVPDCLGDLARPVAPGCSASYPSLLWILAGDARTEWTLPALGRVRWRDASGRVLLRSVALAATRERGGGSEAGRIVMVDAGDGRVLASWGWGVVRRGEKPEKSERRRLGPFTAAPVAVDADEDGVADALYVGDGSGRLWVLRLPAEGGGAERTLPELLYDGARDAAGRFRCAGASDAALVPCAAAAIAESPAVFREEGTRLRVAFVAGAAGRGAPARALVVPDVPGRTFSDADLRAIGGVEAPVLGGCGRPAAKESRGWTLTLPEGERVATAPRVLSGYLWFAGSSVDGRSRLYRLALGNADPCRGEDCCGAPAERGGPSPSGRSLPLVGASDVASQLSAGLDADGGLRLALLTRNEGRPAVASRGVPLRLELRNRRTR